MGSVRTLNGRGTLFMDFRYDGSRCREYTALADTPANRKRLEKAMAKIESDIADGSFDYVKTFPNSRPPAPRQRESSIQSEAGVTEAPAIAVAVMATPAFTVFAEQWFTEHKVEWRRSHIKVLRSTLDGHLLKHFGNKPVGEISKADILAFRTKLSGMPGRVGEKLSNKRINGILAPLRQILNDAADRHGFVSPTASLRPLRVRKTDVEPFTLDQVQQILAAVRGDYRDYFTTRFLTGMRTGEAHGLKWKYVDFEHRLILIRETFVLGEDEYTKTDGSQRDIQMNQVVYEALMRQFEATGKLSDYVFCNREGNPLDNDNFNDRVWAPLLRHLGLKHRRPYQMRHTAATLWLASGEAPEWIARQLGHTSTEMLFRVYSRFVPNLTRQDGSAIDRLLATRFSSGAVRGKGASEDGAPPPSQPPPERRAMPVALA
jgi:integrase